MPNGFGGIFADQAIPFDSLDKTISSEQRSLSHEFNAPLTKVFSETDILKIGFVNLRASWLSRIAFIINKRACMLHSQHAHSSHDHDFQQQ